MNDLLKYENKYRKLGYKLICGVDEAGRGPIAGPVVACAVILKENFKIEGLNDSKKLSKKKRQQLLPKIKEEALSIGVSMIDHSKIDEINILEASRLAMAEAIMNLKIEPDFILTDFMDIDFYIKIPYLSIVKGDLKSVNIAAASIVAKEIRDDYMMAMDEKYPNYDFKNNMGYPTKKHLEAIKKYGITPIHRKSYKPVKNIINSNN